MDKCLGDCLGYKVLSFDTCFISNPNLEFPVTILASKLTFENWSQGSSFIVPTKPTYNANQSTKGSIKKLKIQTVLSPVVLLRIELFKNKMFPLLATKNTRDASIQLFNLTGFWKDPNKSLTGLLRWKCEWKWTPLFLSFLLKVVQIVQIVDTVIKATRVPFLVQGT